MKDKLVRYGHKRPYYTMKKVLISSLLFIGLAGVCAAPIAIAYGVEMAPKAQDGLADDSGTKQEEAAMPSPLSSYLN